MAILSKACKRDNSESHNSPKLSFTNIRGLRSNFVDCESFLESNSPDILALCETNLDDSIDSGNFSVRGYLPLIRKDSSTHMHGLAVYVKEGLPFARDLSLDNSADSYLYFRFALLYSVSYSYIVSIAKTASKKIGALIRSVKFLSPEVALYLYKSTIRPCMEYCCHVWAGAPSCYLELLDKLQKRICRTVGPSLAASLEPLAHRRNVASLSLFYRYYFGRCSSELAELVPLPYSRGRSTRYSDRLHDFSVTIPRCYKDVYVNSFFPRTARLWNSLPMKCFPLRPMILVALSLELIDIF